MCARVLACLCFCVRVCVCLVVRMQDANHIKTYFSCGFWFALATTLIHQGKQYMKKCAADSFERGNVSANAAGPGRTEWNESRQTNITPVLCTYPCVFLCFWDDIFQAFSPSHPQVSINTWIRMRRTRFRSGLVKEQMWLKALKSVVVQLWAKAVSKHLKEWFSGDLLFRFDLFELLSINYSHSENNSQP